jgi:hypothetical protein
MTFATDHTFLTPDEIRELTGYRQHAAQIRWLQREGIRHWVNANGRPVVPLSSINPRGGEPRKEPRFGAM